jgi:hypothetical protein
MHWQWHNCPIGCHNMIIDDERDDVYNDNYHTVTFVVAPPVTYEAPTILTTILQREMYFTSGLMFLRNQVDRYLV